MAAKVPTGMDLLASRRSPDRFEPAMIPEWKRKQIFRTLCNGSFLDWCISQWVVTKTTNKVISHFHDRGLQVLRRYPDQYQWFAGTLQVPRPVSEISRYSAGTPTSTRSLQVRCRYLDQYQWFAGTLHVPWPVSVVCRYPACTLNTGQGTCRYPAGTLTSVSCAQRLANWVFDFAFLKGSSWGDFCSHPRAL